MPILSYFLIISALLCIYGLFVLIEATKPVLQGRSPMGKFFAIKGCLFATLLPRMVIVMGGFIKKYCEHYTKETMQEAWFSPPLALSLFLSFSIKECVVCAPP